MCAESERWIELATELSRQSCAEFALVLETQGIAQHQLQSERGWSLCVLTGDAERASRELDAYRRESRQPQRIRMQPEMVGKGWPGVIAYAAVLMLVAVCLRQEVFNFDWLAVGRMDSGRLVAGQWWRAVTALTLHVDADHLIGNLAFGGFFAYFVARYLGDGLGWLAIIMSGMLGNVVNALAQYPDHLSIGASTAVFGALALLTANTWRRGFPKDTPRRTRIAPLIAGLGLLAYTGAGGENTDIGAHLMGFVAGFVLGAALANYSVPRTQAIQTAAGLFASLLIAAAWVWAYLSS